MSKILIVDDNQEAITSIKSILKSKIPNCVVLTADSGKDGVDKTLYEHPDVVLIDLVMPGMDGYEMCRIIRNTEETKYIPIIAMTGHNASNIRIRSMEAGADAFISKPICTAELVLQIKSMLRLKQAEEILREELDYNRLKVLNNAQNIRKVYEASFEGMVIVQNNKIVVANRKFCSLYECDFENIIGRNITDFVIQELKDKLLNDIKNGCSLECEYSGISKSGKRLYFEVRQEPVTCDDKPAILMVLHDITDLKRSQDRIESLLVLSEKRFDSEESIARYALDEAVRLTNSEVGYLHFVNGGGVEANLDAMTLDLFVWSSGAEDKCIMPKIRHYPLKEAGIWAECVHTRGPAVHNDYQTMPDKKGYPEGHFPITRHMSVPVINGGDTIVAVMGVGNKDKPYTDFDVRQLQLFANSMWYIIKRKRLDIELSSYLDLAPTIFVALDMNGNIKNLNKSGREILECDDAMVGKNWFTNFIPHNVRNTVYGIFNQLVSGDKKFSVAENEVITKKGNVRIVSWRNTVLLNTKGNIETILAAGEDITEQRLAEKELENHWLKEKRRLEDNLKHLSVLGNDTIKPKELDSVNG